MTQEDKELFLKDICARLPFGVKAKITEEGVLSYDSGIGVIVGKEHIDNEIFILQCKNDGWCLTAISEFVPYLRPMSSMTEEEYGIFLNTQSWECGARSHPKYEYTYKTFDWLNEHHFDYHGLISMGLTVEAPEDMYDKNSK